MPVFECPSCKTKLQVADEHAGKTIACPKCQAKAVVPKMKEPEIVVGIVAPEVFPDPVPSPRRDRGRPERKSRDADKKPGERPRERRRLFGNAEAPLAGFGLVTIVLSVGGFLGVFACCGGGCFWVFFATHSVVEASEAFLAQVSRGQTAEAYASTSNEFRARQDQASFTEAVKTLGMTEYASASWHTRSVHNLTGKAEGTVTTKGGGTTPVSIDVVKEDGTWKVASVRYAGVDLATVKPPVPDLPDDAKVPEEPPSKDKIPPEAVLRRMATESLLDLNQAIQTKDFTAFHARIAPTWQKEKTAEQLQAQILALSIGNLDAIKNVRPQFEPAPAIENQELILKGRYRAAPKGLIFNLSYVFDPAAAGWKLSGFSVLDLEPLPPDAELRRLATESLLDLDQAFRSKDFTAFHAKLHTVFRKETTPQQLKQAFQKSIDAGLDFGVAKTLRAQFDPAPKVDENNGRLVLIGRYPTTPRNLLFSLTYAYEPAGWKLVGISVERAAK